LPLDPRVERCRRLLLEQEQAHGSAGSWLLLACSTVRSRLTGPLSRSERYTRDLVHVQILVWSL
jgi:hypothetical protein